MPSAAPHCCPVPHCSALVPYGQARCDRHTKEQKRAADKARPSARQRGYTTLWQKIRLEVLREAPLCQQCEANHVVRVAVEVHHRLPLSKGGSHDRSNLVPLCEDCHRELHREKVE